MIKDFRLIPACLVLVIASACTIPTDAPVVDERWIVPSQTTRIGVGTLLPSNVTVPVDSSGFVVAITPTTVTRTLGQDCPSCAAANGLVAPKPAFVGTAASNTALPVDVSSATISSGALQLVVQNNYTFDPLRPSAAAGSPRGNAVIVVTNNGAVIGKDSVDGSAFALPAGGSLTRSVTLSGTVTGAQPVVVTVTVNSPAGDPVLIDASRTLVATASVPAGIKVASANVNVVNKTISSTSTSDLGKIDSTIMQKVQGGALLLTITNPFAVAGTLTVTLTPTGGAPIVRTIQIAANTTTTTVSFSKAEIQRLLGHFVTYSFSGPVTAAAAVNVTPKQVVLVQTKLSLDFELGTVKQ